MRRFHQTLCGASLLAAALATACDRSDDPTWEVDLKAQTKDQVIETLVMNTCGREEVCGVPRTSCAGRADHPHRAQCSGTIEKVDYETCATAYRETLERELDGCPLNRLTRQLMEDCVNPALAKECASEADLQRLLSDAEVEPPPEPEACTKLFDVEWADCGQHG